MYLPIISILVSEPSAKPNKGTENVRPKILEEAGVIVLTFVIIILLVGVAARLPWKFVSMGFGTVVGLVSEVGVSLVIGYVVKKRMGRLDW